MTKDLEPIFHPEEEDDAAHEGRPVSLAKMFTYHHHKHEIKLGSLVEVDIKIYMGGRLDENGNPGPEVNIEGKCKLYVVKLTRDCDGTPLYNLCNLPVLHPTNHGHTDYSKESMTYEALAKIYERGYSASSLKVIGYRELAPDMAAFYGA